MSFIGPRIPLAICLFREDPTTTHDSCRRRSAPPVAKRRSVASMKDLMPLSLPNPRSSTPSSDREDSMDLKDMQCFPEVLARDLEICSSLFEAKNMTAGTPSMSLIYEERKQQRTMSCPGRLLTSPYRTASIRVKNLGAIEERGSVVSFLDRRGYASEATSDVDSLPATESSSGLEGPSIHFRQRSIMTAATSLTSASGSAPSPKALVSRPLCRERSWIDIDSDDDDLEMEEEVARQRVGALSPRPPTPMIADNVSAHNKSPKEAPRSRTPLYKRTTISSLREGLSRRNSLRSVDIPPRIASLACTTTCSNPFPPRPETPCPVPSPRSSDRASRRQLNLPSHARYLYRFESEPSPSLTPPPEKMSDYDANSSDYDDDSIFDAETGPWRRPSTVYIQTTPPPSPMPTVQAWLDRSHPPLTPQLPIDDLAKAVPLPPDVVETLRVSIACFPETMLLSSSLTVETIRTYSKKVRHPPADIWREPSEESSPQSNRRSVWKRVVSHGRDSISMRLHRSHSSIEDFGAAETPAQDASASPNAWAPLRHVFGSCSDYICDALYAHIVAYNYISRVPRSQPPSSHRVSTASSRKSQNEDIPKKAASLLGLDSPQCPAQPTFGRVARKFGSPLSGWSFGRDEMTADSGSVSAAQDNTTRNIEAGLLRCIMRLISTARMMAEEGGGEERMMETEAQEVDMTFVRSLCEIVRISEEAAAAS